MTRSGIKYFFISGERIWLWDFPPLTLPWSWNALIGVKIFLMQSQICWVASDGLCQVFGLRIGAGQIKLLPFHLCLWLKQWKETKAKKKEKGEKKKRRAPRVLGAGVNGLLDILKSRDENPAWQSEQPPHHSGDALNGKDHDGETVILGGLKCSGSH